MKTKMLLGLCIFGIFYQINAFAGPYERHEGATCEQTEKVVMKITEIAKRRTDLLKEWLKLSNRVADLLMENKMEEISIYEREMDELKKQIDTTREEDKPLLDFLRECGALSIRS